MGDFYTLKSLIEDISQFQIGKEQFQEMNSYLGVEIVQRKGENSLNEYSIVLLN